MKGKQTWMRGSSLTVVTAWLLAGCHVDPQAGNTGVPGRPQVAVVEPASTHALESEFFGEPDISDLDATKVLSIQPVVVDATASANDGVDECTEWALSSEEAEALFAMSQPVDARAWDEDYGSAPCTISGTLRSGGVEWQFSINGAAKAQWTHGATVRYLGCGERECEAFGA